MTSYTFPNVAAAVAEYHTQTGFSIWEHDGDTWADNGDYATALRAAANRERSVWRPLSYCLCNHSQLAHNIPASEEAPDQYGPRCVLCECVGFERDVLGYDLSVGAPPPHKEPK